MALHSCKRKCASTPVSDVMSSISLCFSPDGLRRSAFNLTPFGDLGGGFLRDQPGWPEDYLRMRWGKKRLVLCVMAWMSSRIPIPQARSPTTQLPSTAYPFSDRYSGW